MASQIGPDTATPLIGLRQASRKRDCTCLIQNHGCGPGLDVMCVQNRS